MFAGNLAQFFEIADGWHQHAGGSRHGFDNDRGDGLCAMQGDNGFQIIGEVSAPFGTAFGKGVMFKIMGVRKMVNTRQQRAKLPPVVDDAANRNAAKANAVIAAFPSD